VSIEGYISHWTVLKPYNYGNHFGGGGCEIIRGNKVEYVAFRDGCEARSCVIPGDYGIECIEFMVLVW
jgi:hypothetical protein